jgi:hypothetical protein
MMASPTVAEETSNVQGRWQVSLADLIFLVLAAGLGVGIARGARDVWGIRGTGPTGAVPIPFARTAGVVAEVAAVWLAMILARGMIGLIRGRQGSSGAAPRARLLASMGWRALAIVFLIGLTMRESRILRVDYGAFEARSSAEPWWRYWYQLREMLIPICAILAMIGVALGAGAGRAFGRSDPGRRRPYWLFVPLAAIVGVLIMGLPYGWWSMITQLVLLAIEAVNNAMRPEYRATSGSLSVRLLRAGIEAVPAALACLWLALVVAHDFERQRRAEPWAATWGGWLLRVLSLATALATGAVVGLVTIPTVSPRWLDGIREVLEPEIIAIVIAGFAIFAAGLAARALTPSTVTEGPRWTSRLLAAAVPCGLLALILVSALQCLPPSTQLDPAVPSIVGRVCDLVREVLGWILSLIPDSGQINFAAWLDPERLAWTLATAAVALFIVELSVSRPSGDQPAPFDTVAETTGGMGRFFWLTAALTAVCLVALPTLAVLGQVIVHIRFWIDDWAVNGWPSPF